MSEKKMEFSLAIPESEPFCVWLGNLPASAMINDVFDYLALFDVRPKDVRFGRVHSHRHTCAYVDFYNQCDMIKALESIHCSDAPLFMERKLKIDINEGIKANRSKAIQSASYGFYDAHRYQAHEYDDNAYYKTNKKRVRVRGRTFNDYGNYRKHDHQYKRRQSVMNNDDYKECDYQSNVNQNRYINQRQSDRVNRNYSFRGQFDGDRNYVNYNNGNHRYHQLKRGRGYQRGNRDIYAY